jgi:glucose-1-phosphate cytidylyltransferase
MKLVILAGGLGTRISEESHLRPKPMIEIGGRPILHHIMKIYAAHGVKEFVVCCGYKGYVIKEYFANYFLHMSDVTFDLSDNSMVVHKKYSDDWKVTLVDTGEFTQTGGRIKRIRDHIDDSFCLTYGDGVSDIDISALIEFHNSNDCMATVSAIQPSGRFGALGIEGNKVSSFVEKPEGDGRWVNGGFFVCEPSIFDHIGGDDTIFEQETLINLSSSGELAVWKHEGFWSAMDTLRDKEYLEKLWESGNAPWKQW